MYQDVRIPRRPTLPSGWRVVRLEDTVEVNRDQWDPEEGSGILYLDLTAVIAPGRLAAPKELAARDAPSRARRRVAAGDILVSTVRPYLRGFAKVTQAPNNLIASTGFAVLTPRDEVDGSLIYHHVMAPSFALYLEANMTGQAYPAVRPSDVATYPILLPPLAEQRAIAAVLDSIDGAIERNDDVIAATERLRDALLHELLTRGVPGWHSAWKDVPGLGTVPADWEVVRLGDVCEPPQYGAAAPAIPFDPSLPRYVRITDITDDGRLRPDDARSAEPSQALGYELQAGDLLFARSGATVGKTYLYESSDGPCVYAGYLIRFQARLGLAKANVPVVVHAIGVLSSMGCFDVQSRCAAQHQCAGVCFNVCSLTADWRAGGHCWYPGCRRRGRRARARGAGWAAGAEGVGVGRAADGAECGWGCK